MTDFDVRTTNLRAVNSMTKYPPIPTYHALGPKNGLLLPEAVRFEGTVIGTEKIDGTNARIILLPEGDYLIGSREELLYAKGDRIGNPSQGIVENLRPVADLAAGSVTWTEDVISVLYLELFGGKIGAQAKQYSARGAVGWRLFDVAYIEHYREKQAWPPERISAWRDAGGQRYADESQLHREARHARVELAPRLFTIDAAELPTDIEKTAAWIAAEAPSTLVALDDTGKGRAEGIVLRTRDRSVIAKARFQDYERTLRRRGGAS